MSSSNGLRGYAPLASLMSTHPEVAIFRKFSTLNAQNLLYLQAELVYLESKLQQYATEDRVAGLAAESTGGEGADKLKYETDWYMLANSDDEDEDSLQWQMVLEIRAKLKEYSTSISDNSFLNPDRQRRSSCCRHSNNIPPSTSHV